MDGDGSHAARGHSMDVKQAGTAPLTEEEIVATSRRLRALRHQLLIGELSNEQYGEQVRSVLERRKRSVPGYVPDRRQSGANAAPDDR